MQASMYQNLKRTVVKSKTRLVNTTYTSQAIELNSSLLRLPPGSAIDLNLGDVIDYNTLTVESRNDVM